MMKNFRKNLKSVHQICGLLCKDTPWYLPSLVLQRILLAIRPFAALFFSARILDLLADGCEREQMLLWIALAVGVHYGLYLMAQLLGSVQTSEEMQSHWSLYGKLSDTAMKVNYQELESPDVSEKMLRVVQAARMYGFGPWGAPSTLANALEGLTVTAAAILMTAPVLWKIGTRMPLGALLFAGMVAVEIYYTVFSERKLYQMQAVDLSEVAKEYQLSDFCVQYASKDRAAKDVRLYAQQPVLKDLMARMLRVLQECMGRQGYSRARSQGLQAFFTQLITVFAYAVIGVYAVRGLFSVGSIVQSVGALTQLAGGLRMLTNAVLQLSAQGPYCREYLDLVESVDDTDTVNRTSWKNSSLKTGEVGFHFEHVSFQYPGAKDWAVKDINLSVKPGEHLALVGQNGSGKTTLIKLLCRLYRPTEGRITLNGRDIWTCSLEEYWKLFSVVFQDFSLFDLPLDENIASEKQCDEQRVRSCLKEAGITGWDDRLLHQQVNTGGQTAVNVSGGEAQKIAIARALYKDAPFVLMDEPTAALDAEAEATIYEHLDRMTRNKGAIYISHRLSSCRLCDRIAVLKEGRLIQCASHEELIKNQSGEYYRLWNAQAQYYT